VLWVAHVLSPEAWALVSNAGMAKRPRGPFGPHVVVGVFFRQSRAVSDGALKAASLIGKKVAPLSAPFGGLCPQLRSLCDFR
jgi:hypothetical protein